MIFCVFKILTKQALMFNSRKIFEKLQERNNNNNDDDDDDDNKNN